MKQVYLLVLLLATEHVQSSNLLHVVLHSYGWLQCNIYVHLVSVGSINHCRIWCLKDSILYHCQWDDIPGGEMNKHKRWSFHLTGFQMCSMSAIWLHNCRALRYEENLHWLPRQQQDHERWCGKCAMCIHGKAPHRLQVPIEVSIEYTTSI